jgi:hypothetical protein
MLKNRLCDYCTLAQVGKRTREDLEEGDTLLWKGTFMPKKKQKIFRADKIVKEMARERIGAPPASRIVPDRKKKVQEQKPTTKELLKED